MKQNPRPDRRPSPERGFTLIEVLVAALILTLALLSLSSLFALGIKNNAVAKEDTIMAALAQEKLEELKQLPTSTLDNLFTAPCNTMCEAGCEGASPCCTRLCYHKDCATFVFQNHQDPIPDANPGDDVKERLYVRRWEVERINLGLPVGCMRKITVTVGSRNGLMAPRAPGGVSWLHASWTDVVGNGNPRRVAVATFK